MTEGFRKPGVSYMESAGGIHFLRGEQGVAQRARICSFFCLPR